MEIKNYMKYKHVDCIFYIKKSKICEGLGIFAKNDIEKNKYITWYYGYTTRFFKVSKKNKYSINYSSRKYKNTDFVLVGVKDIKRLHFKGAAQLANDAICWDITKKTNNSIFIQNGKYVFLKSTVNIKRDEEILVSYGFNYWIYQINNFPYEYNNEFKFVINIINYLIQLTEQCIKTEVYEYIGLFENIIKFDLTEKKRWCIFSLLYHEDIDFYLLLDKDDHKVNIYYKCNTCSSRLVFLESLKI